MSIGFSNIGMIAATAATVVGSYTLSLSVAAERARVDDTRREIASNFRDIRALEAELRTRARLPQLERWNVEVLALQAPRASQFADGPTQLVGYAPKAMDGEVRPQFAIGDRPAVQAGSVQTVAYRQPQSTSFDKLRTSGDVVASKAPATVEVAQIEPAHAEPVEARAAPTVVAAQGLTATLAASIESAAATESSGFRTVAAR